MISLLPLITSCINIDDTINLIPGESKFILAMLRIMVGLLYNWLFLRSKEWLPNYSLKNTNKLLKIISCVKKSQLQQADFFNVFFLSTDLFIIANETRHHWDGDHASRKALHALVNSQVKQHLNKKHFQQFFIKQALCWCSIKQIGAAMTPGTWYYIFFS